MEATLSMWQELFSKLDGLASLSDGWNSYAAPAPSASAIAVARCFLTSLQQDDCPPTRIAPSAMGGVGITHRQGSRKIYAEFYNDGSAHALFSNGRESMETRKVPIDPPGTRQFIADMRKYLDG